MTRCLYRFVLIIAGFPLAALLFSGCNTVPRTMAPGSFSTVVIDAGHGGKDSGEHPPGGLYEKTVALDTAERVRDLLNDEGLHTVMTRSSDVFVELDDRVAIADRYGPGAVLVSIHYNASPSSAPLGSRSSSRGNSATASGPAARVAAAVTGRPRRLSISAA